MLKKTEGFKSVQLEPRENKVKKRQGLNTQYYQLEIMYICSESLVRVVWKKHAGNG